MGVYTRHRYNNKRGDQWHHQLKLTQLRPQIDTIQQLNSQLSQILQPHEDTRRLSLLKVRSDHILRPSVYLLLLAQVFNVGGGPASLRLG